MSLSPPPNLFQRGLQALSGLVPARPQASPPPRPFTPPEEEAKRLRTAAQATYHPDDAERQYVQMVKQRFERSKSAKEVHYERWARSLAFYLNRQWDRWEPVARQLLPPSVDVPSWRERISDNQVTQMVLTWAAKQNKARHITIALPNNPQDEQDGLAADTATKVLRHLDRITDRGAKRRDLEILRAVYGTAILFPFWNADAKTTLALIDPATGQPKGKEAFLGDQDFEVLTVWECFPQPARRWADVKWCLKVRVRSLEWVRDTFPERGPLVDAERAEAALFGLSDAHLGDTGMGAAGKEEQCRVLEYYERPCRQYPQGRWAIAAGDILLYREDSLPSPAGDFPFVPVQGYLVPERLWGMGVVEHLIGQQEYLNKTESLIAEEQKMMARGKWAIAREANVEEKALHSGPGEVVEYDATGGGGPPVPIAPPGLQAYVVQQPEQTIERMGRIAGINEVSRADTPPNVSSGVAISLLQDTDNTRFSFFVDDEADAWKELDRQQLRSVQVRYTVPRFIRVIGDKDEQGVLALLGTDLRGNTEVGLDTTEGVDDSVGAKRQRCMDYVQAGFFTQLDPADVPGLFRVMEENRLAELAEERQARIQQQQKQAQAAQEQQMQEQMALQGQATDQQAQMQQAEAEHKQALAALEAQGAEQEQQTQALSAQQQLQQAQQQHEQGLAHQQDAHAVSMAQGVQKLALAQQAAEQAAKMKEQQGKQTPRAVK